jgi:glycosyltransferase involved in cell wall biosynthesis
VLFFRRLRGLTGGHLKVWDFFRHTLDSGDHTARIVFSADSVWTQENPWRDARQFVVASASAVRPDLYFFGAFDWENLPPAERARSSVPVLNLIAHVRHGDPKDPRFPLLQNRAIRICVSAEVAAAIRAHATPNGPVVVIPNAVNVAEAPAVSQRDVDLVVVALKQPDLGRRLAKRLARRGRAVELLDARLPRVEFLRRLARARTALCLPHETEGFYLPAIEAMALGTLVVCPDAVGNREFCQASVNCLFPAFEEGAILAAAEEALSMPAAARDALVAAGRATAARHGLDRERRAFVELLREAPRLWSA